MGGFKDMTGLRFGRLVVDSYVDSVRPSGLPGPAKWLCFCDCGGRVVTRGDCLRGGQVSCGCLTREVTSARVKAAPPRLKHGGSSGGKSDEYKIWSGIVRRCENVNSRAYKNYGGRGIGICDRWRNGNGGRSGYELFLADVGPRPSRNHSIDRIDVDKGYHPGNVRWADWHTQMRNTRKTRYVEYDGQKLAASEAAQKYGVPYASLLQRLNAGWSAERALKQPIRLLKI
jgi:hypothetical protein